MFKRLGAAPSSLPAHSLTPGMRIAVVADSDGLLRLDDLASQYGNGVGIVQAIRCTGERMRVFLWYGGIVYTGINDKATIIL